MERLLFLPHSDVGRAVLGIFFDDLGPGVRSRDSEGSLMKCPLDLSFERNGTVLFKGEKDAIDVVFEGGRSLII